MQNTEQAITRFQEVAAANTVGEQVVVTRELIAAWKGAENATGQRLSPDGKETRRTPIQERSDERRETGLKVPLVDARRARRALIAYEAELRQTGRVNKAQAVHLRALHAYAQWAWGMHMNLRGERIPAPRYQEEAVPREIYAASDDSAKEAFVADDSWWTAPPEEISTDMQVLA
jgi:hypothetical protein